MRNNITLILIAFNFFTISLKAQTFSPTFNIANSGAADNFKGGYTFSYATAGTPWNGSLISYGGGTNNYDTQISSDYGPNGGNHISYRTRNGDVNNWNPWYELAIRGANTFTGNQTIIGNVGIGTTTPMAILDISGNLILRNYENISGKGNIINFTSYGHDLHGPQIRSYLYMADGVNSRMGLMLSSYSQGYKNELFLIDGHVGIGTTTPDSELAVNGIIHSQEVRVDIYGWPDYVFKRGYDLPTLQEVETHIKEKGHLTNIPSEEEVLKNGVNLGEMNAKLLQKIEEMTLYMIQQNKKIADLENRLEKVETR